MEYRELTKKRLQAMCEQQRRLNKLGLGWNANVHLHYGGLAPRGSFATDSFGLSDAEVKIMDHAGHAALGPTSGRSALRACDAREACHRRLRR